MISTIFLIKAILVLNINTSIKFLSLGCFGLVILAIIYYLYCLFSAQLFFQTSQNGEDNFTPAISILKPLCGLEAGLEQNLISFINQKYPQYQVIFCVRDPEDPVIELVEKLIDKFPNQDLKLVIDDRLIGHNYKVSNLANGLPYCKYDLILIADSDIEVREDYLRSIVQPLQSEKVGVVTCLYQSQGNQLIDIFEALNVTSNFIPSVLVGQQIEGINYAFGSTILIRKQILTQIGNFKELANSLADDFLLGNLATQAGYEISLSNYIVQHHIANETFFDYCARQIRWYRCIKVQRFFGYCGMIITQGTIVSLLFVLVTHESNLSLWLLLITIFIRLFMTYLVAVKNLQNPTVSKYLPLVFLVDIVSFGLWLSAFWGNKVKWRNHTFILDRHGKLKLSSRSH